MLPGPDARRSRSNRPPRPPPVLAARAPVDVEDLREIQEQLQRVVAQVLPATVSVEIGDAAGSGVIVSKDGLVLTAAHVIGRPGRRAWIELPDGRRLRGRTLGADHEADAGMIQLDYPPSRPAVRPDRRGPPRWSWASGSSPPASRADWSPAGRRRCGWAACCSATTT